MAARARCQQVRPDPSLEWTATGKPPWPRGALCLSSASRPRRLTGVRPSAQTLDGEYNMSEYLKDQLQEALAVLDTCLECIYRGKTHMYRALAGQIRLLLCDAQRQRDNSLLPAVYPRLEVSALEPIGWSATGAGGVHLVGPPNSTNRIAQMPIEVVQYSNGLVIANLLLKQDALLPIRSWQDQHLTFHPARLTVRSVVRSVADKGGGAHVDASASPELRLMYERTPPGPTYAELFTVAIGRYLQQIGERLLGHTGCKVPEELTSKQHQVFNLLVAAHKDVAA